MLRQLSLHRSVSLFLTVLAPQHHTSNLAPYHHHQISPANSRQFPLYPAGVSPTASLGCTHCLTLQGQTLLTAQKLPVRKHGPVLEVSWLINQLARHEGHERRECFA